MVEYDYLLKICVYADKDECIEAFACNVLHEELKEYWGLTIGAEFFVKDLPINKDKDARLQLWLHRDDSTNTKGVWGLYMEGSLGIILIHDLTDRKSLDVISERITFIRNLHNNFEVPILLVDIKSDVEANREITKEQLAEFKEDYNISDPISFSPEEDGKKIFKNLLKMMMPDFDENYYSLNPPDSIYS